MGCWRCRVCNFFKTTHFDVLYFYFDKMVTVNIEENQKNSRCRINMMMASRKINTDTTRMFARLAIFIRWHQSIGINEKQTKKKRAQLLGNFSWSQEGWLNYFLFSHALCASYNYINILYTFDSLYTFYLCFLHYGHRWSCTYTLKLRMRANNPTMWFSSIWLPAPTPH